MIVEKSQFNLANEQRIRQLSSWLETHFKQSVELKVVSGDASFRRYFRFWLAGKSYIAVDSPPQTEKNQEFVAIATAYAKQGILATHKQNQYKNEVGQPADGDYVGNWWIVGQTYSGDRQGWLERVPGL